MTHLERNAAKLWKWVSLLVERGAGSLRVRPTVTSLDVEFVILRQERFGPWKAVGKIAYDHQQIVLARGNEADWPLPEADTRELRTQKVVPYLASLFRVATDGEPAPVAAFPVAFRALGHFAASRRCSAFSDEEGVTVRTDAGLAFSLTDAFVWDRRARRMRLLPTADWAAEELVSALSGFARGEGPDELIEENAAAFLESAGGAVHFDPEDPTVLILDAEETGPQVWSVGHGLPERLGLPAGSTAFWGPRENRWLVSTGGAAMRWPPARGEIAHFPAYPDPGVLPRSGISAGADHCTIPRGYGSHVFAGPPPANVAEWEWLDSRRQSCALEEYGPVVFPTADGGFASVNPGDQLVTCDSNWRNFSKIAGRPGGHPEGGAAHPTEPLVVSCSRHVEFFDLESKRMVGFIGLREKPAAAFTPDGRFLLLLEPARLLMLRLSTRSLRAVMPLPRGDRYSIAISFDGSSVALRSAATWVIPWRRLEELFATAPELLGRFHAPDSGIYF